MELFSRGDEGYIARSVLDNSIKFMQHMHDATLFLLDFWADLFVYLLLLESSIG